MKAMTNGESMIAPCPFCAGVRTEVVEIDVGKWMVECRDCQTTGPIDKSPVLAKERWNSRQQPVSFSARKVYLPCILATPRRVHQE